MFTAIHGSADASDGRLIANGSKIMRSQNVGGAWITFDFATGFLTDSINYIRWARPAGIIIDSAGDLYFSSDNSSPHSPPAIFKISYVGENAVESSNEPIPSLNVYPNPASDDLHVNIVNPIAASSISIDDMLGREVMRESIPTTSPIDIDIHKLIPGVYLLRASLKSGNIEKQFIISR